MDDLTYGELLARLEFVNEYLETFDYIDSMSYDRRKTMATFIRYKDELLNAISKFS